MRRLVVPVAALAVALGGLLATPAAAAGRPLPPLPSTIDGGAWDTSHLQGVHVDRARDQVLWSFTTVLVRTDLDGKVLGTVTGLTGHLGDLDQDPRDGRVYGSLEYKAEEAFYVAIFDPRRITRVGMDATTDDVMSVVYLPDVVDDFTADMDGDGVFDGNAADTADHRYGASGIDGVAFGPDVRTGRGSRLTVAYGVYENLERTDNDNQVLLQLDTRTLGRYERTLDAANPERVGPRARKYFVHTGNTRYGIQNLEHDPVTGHWFAAVYPGSKPTYPNFSLFVIDGRKRPVNRVVSGQAEREVAPHLSLARLGTFDRESRTWGYTFDASYGLQSMGGGLFYRGLGRPLEPGETGRNAGILDLHRFTGRGTSGFVAG